MNLINFPGLCCYIPQGPDSTRDEDILNWYEWLTSQPAGDDVGATFNSNPDAASAARASNQTLAKVGPVVGIYDPEWNAWLAGDIT